MPDKCRSCGAEVLFVPSAKTGKLMILNAAPDQNGRIIIHGDGKASVLTDGGLFTSRQVNETRYMDHHASCPQAQQWRRSKVKDS